MLVGSFMLVKKILLNLVLLVICLSGWISMLGRCMLYRKKLMFLCLGVLGLVWVIRML